MKTKCDSCGGMHESRADEAACKMDKAARVDGGGILIHERTNKYQLVEELGGQWYVEMRSGGSLPDGQKRAGPYTERAARDHLKLYQKEYGG